MKIVGKSSLVTLTQILLMASFSLHQVAGNQGGGNHLRTTVVVSEESSSFSSSCDPNPCQNNGHCHTVAIHKDADSQVISCLCAFGYYGPFCSETNDEMTLKYARPTVSGEQNHDHGRRKLDGARSSSLTSKNVHRRQQNVDATTSTWKCFTLYPPVHVGSVEIWWGHTDGDGSWACNAWIPDCAGGRCYATDNSVSTCMESNTPCDVATTCNNCCNDGAEWNWQGFGYYCN